MQDFYKILIIDLENKDYKIDLINPDIYKRYMGGYGLGFWWLATNLEIKEAFMVFTSAIIDKSNPINKYIIIDYHDNQLIYGNMGGNFSDFLKLNDFDAIILLNKSNTLTDVIIDRSDIRFVNTETDLDRKNTSIYNDIKDKYGDNVSSLYITESAIRGDNLARLISDKYRGISKNMANSLYNKNISSIVVKENQLREINYYQAKMINQNSRCETCIIGCRIKRADKFNSIFSNKDHYDDLDIKKLNKIRNTIDEYGMDLFSLSKSLEFAFKNLNDIYKFKSLDLEDLEKIINKIIDPDRSPIYQDLANGDRYLKEKYKVNTSTNKNKKQSKNNIKIIDSAGICLFSVNHNDLGDISFIINKLSGVNYTSEDLKELLSDIKGMESKLVDG